jgi:hypothetical protein
MKKLCTTLLCLLGSIAAFSQYKFDYRLKLNDKTSTYSESTVQLPDSTKLGLIKFSIENTNEQKLSFINISIKNKKTTINTKTDSTGTATINLNPGTYTFTISGNEYNPVILKDVEILKANSIKYSINLAETSDKKTAKLRCSKKLSDKQIDGILRDINKGKLDSELIKCRICFLSFE